MGVFTANLANRMAKITLKQLKHGNEDNLLTINKAFGRFAQQEGAQDLRSSFKIKLNKFSQRENLNFTTDYVAGQKYPRLTGSLTRGKNEDAASFADNGFELGQEMGELLKAENRNPHLSPRYIYKTGKTTDKASMDYYTQALSALKQHENELGSLSGDMDVKILKNGVFRIRKQSNAECIPPFSVGLTKRSEQTQEEFVDEAVRYAKLIDEFNPFVNPDLALKSTPFKTQIHKEGLARYQEATTTFKARQEAFRRLTNVPKVQAEMPYKDEIRVTNSYGRQYVFNQNQSTPDTTRFIEDGVKFATNAALRSDNVSAGLMLKNRFNKKFSEEGYQRFNKAATVFENNKEALRELGEVGINLRINHDGDLQIFRYADNKEVFYRLLKPQGYESLESLITRGFEFAELLKIAPVPPQKSILRKVGGLFKKKDALPPLRPSRYERVYPLSNGQAHPSVETPVIQNLPHVQAEVPVIQEQAHIQAEAPVVQEQAHIQAEAPVVKEQADVQPETPVIHERPDPQPEIPVARKQPHSQPAKSVFKDEDYVSESDILWSSLERVNTKPPKLTQEQLAQREGRGAVTLPPHHNKWRRLTSDELALKQAQELETQTAGISEAESGNVSRQSFEVSSSGEGSANSRVDYGRTTAEQSNSVKMTTESASGASSGGMSGRLYKDRGISGSHLDRSSTASTNQNDVYTEPYNEGFLKASPLLKEMRQTSGSVGWRKMLPGGRPVEVRTIKTDIPEAGSKDGVKNRVGKFFKKVKKAIAD